MALKKRDTRWDAPRAASTQVRACKAREHAPITDDERTPPTRTPAHLWLKARLSLQGRLNTVQVQRRLWVCFGRGLLRGFVRRAIKILSSRTVLGTRTGVGGIGRLACRLSHSQRRAGGGSCDRTFCLNSGG